MQTAPALTTADRPVLPPATTLALLLHAHLLPRQPAGAPFLMPLDSTSLWNQIQRGESPPLPQSPAASFGADPRDRNAVNQATRDHHRDALEQAGQAATANEQPRKGHGHRTRLPIDVPTDADLTLRNIRLLNLDTLPDYPGIDAHTFRHSSTLARDALARGKSRLATGEWLLYRLFELYHPRDTRDKLSTYFPALEPRQSIHLRAALLQMLMTLKAESVLPRDCSLRKSVLDEMKGERFEELLLYFSSVVLRTLAERTGSSKKRRVRTESEALFGGRAIDEEDEQRLAVLTLATSAALREQMREKDVIRHRLAALSASLSDAKSALEKKKVRDERATLAAGAQLQEAKMHTAHLKGQLRDACASNLNWLNLAISGDNNTDRDASLEVPFPRLWKSALADGTPRPDAVPNSVLVGLGERLSEQKARLDNWRAFQATLSARNQQLTAYHSPFKTPGRSQSKLSRIDSARHQRNVSNVSPSKRRSVSPTKTAAPGINGQRMSTLDASKDLSSVIETSSMSEEKEASGQPSSPIRLAPSPFSPQSPLFHSRQPATAATPRSNAEAFELNHHLEAHLPPSSRPASNLPGPPPRRPTQASPVPAPEHRADRSTVISLAERTMQSMRQADSLKKKRESFFATLESSRPAPTAETLPPVEAATTTDDSLASRTRASMAALQAKNAESTKPAPQAKPKRQHRKSSSIGTAFPVNPWDQPSPVASKRLSDIEALQEEMAVGSPRPQTPTEVLFDDGIDAQSVFKTRSRMRRSPPPQERLSPWA